MIDESTKRYLTIAPFIGALLLIGLNVITVKAYNLGPPNLVLILTSAITGILLVLLSNFVVWLFFSTEHKQEADK